MKEKILITGGSGLLGLNWPIYSKKNLEVILLLNKRKVKPTFANTISLKNYKVETVKSIIEKESPDFVLHCAAITDVDYCEKNKNETLRTNIELTKLIADICKDKKVKLIFISTDQLFDGNKKLYSENDMTSPINSYAYSKYLAEKAITKVSKSSLIIRTNFYGWGTSYRKSFSDFIIDNISKKNFIELFNDVYYTPIFIGNLVELVSKLIEKDAKGIYNVCGNDRITKFDFGKKLANKFKLNTNFINDTSISKSKLYAPRTLDMSLSNLKIKEFLKIEIPNLNDQIDYLKDSMKNKKIRELIKL